MGYLSLCKHNPEKMGENRGGVRPFDLPVCSLNLLNLLIPLLSSQICPWGYLDLRGLQRDTSHKDGDWSSPVVLSECFPWDKKVHSSTLSAGPLSSHWFSEVCQSLSHPRSSILVGPEGLSLHASSASPGRVSQVGALVCVALPISKVINPAAMCPQLLGTVRVHPTFRVSQMMPIFKNALHCLRYST